MGEDAGKIATDILTKTAEMGKAAASMAQNPENAGEIAKDILAKSAKSATGKVTQAGQQAGQGM